MKPLHCSVKNVGSATKPMRHSFQTDMPPLHMRCEGLELSLFGQPRSGRQSVVFVMSHESE